MPAVHHIVLLRFEPDVADQTVDELFDQLSGLQETIPGITYFAGGPYASHEGLNSGYTHGFLMTFEAAAARDAYLPILSTSASKRRSCRMSSR